MREKIESRAMYSNVGSEYDVPDDVMMEDIKIILWDTVRWIERKGPRPNVNVQRALGSWYRHFRQ